MELCFCFLYKKLPLTSSNFVIMRNRKIAISRAENSTKGCSFRSLVARVSRHGVHVLVDRRQRTVSSRRRIKTDDHRRAVGSVSQLDN